jgi:hypothetical protein
MIAVNRANESQKNSVSMMFCASSILSMIISCSIFEFFAACVNVTIRITLSLLEVSSMISAVLREILPRLNVLRILDAFCNLNVS